MLCALSLKSTYEISKRFSSSDKSIQTKRRKINVIKTKVDGRKEEMRMRRKKMVTRRADNHRRHSHPPSPPMLTSPKQKKDEFDESLLQYFCLVYWLKNVSKSNYSALLLTANDEVHTHAHPVITTIYQQANTQKKVIAEQKPSKNNLLFQKQLQKTFAVPNDKPNCTDTAGAADVLVVLLLLSKHVTLCWIECPLHELFSFGEWRKEEKSAHTERAREEQPCNGKRSERNERKKLKDTGRKICTKLHYFPLDTIRKWKRAQTAAAVAKSCIHSRDYNPFMFGLV